MSNARPRRHLEIVVTGVEHRHATVETPEDFLAVDVSHDGVRSLSGETMDLSGVDALVFQ